MRQPIDALAPKAGLLTPLLTAGRLREPKWKKELNKIDKEFAAVMRELNLANRKQREMGLDKLQKKPKRSSWGAVRGARGFLGSPKGAAQTDDEAEDEKLALMEVRMPPATRVRE